MARSEAKTFACVSLTRAWTPLKWPSRKRAITIAKLCDLYVDAVRKGMVADEPVTQEGEHFIRTKGRISAHIKPLGLRPDGPRFDASPVRRFFEDVVRAKRQGTIHRHVNPWCEAGLIAGKRSVGLLGVSLGYGIRLGIAQKGQQIASGG